MKLTETLLHPVYEFRPLPDAFGRYRGETYRFADGEWLPDDGEYDLAIFHRTCTFMANSGAKHLYAGMKKENGLNESRWLPMGRDAWAFWDHMQRSPIGHAAWENPVMLGYAQLMIGNADQTVQPWWFGTDEEGPDNVKKATCWWLRKLPKLARTGTLDGSTARDEVFRMAPTADPEERRMARSRFTPGHADAVADQWGRYVMNRRAAEHPEALEVTEQPAVPVNQAIEAGI